MKEENPSKTSINQQIRGVGGSILPPHPKGGDRLMRTNNHSIVDKIVNTADEFGFFWNDFVPAILQPIPKHGLIPSISCAA